jgi:hypothetical protein
MRETLHRSGNLAAKQLAAIDQLLIAGIKLGPAKKREAINRVLELVPQWKRGDCWRRIKELRRAAKRAALEERHPAKTKKSRDATQAAAAPRPAPRSWTPADDDRLLNLAGYEPVKRIAQRLDRSVRAVRFRMAALGMSARVTDAWSLRALWKMLRIRPSRLRYFIGNGLLRVRDARIAASSLAAFCEQNQPSVAPSTIERVTTALAKGDEGYTWERAAELLGLTVAQVQSGISAGQLRVVDTLVTDRSFEEFCKKHGDQINTMLIDPATAKWLVSEYGVSESVIASTTVAGVQKHALVTRACHCGRTIAGNAFFRHARTCQSVNSASIQSQAKLRGPNCKSDGAPGRGVS